jgi:enamine deaminase RidA (YjgF/YER057c/UK114 family)
LTRARPALATFNIVTQEASEPERDDPFGGAFGASLAVRAGSFVFTSALGGVISMDEGEPQFAETFDEQLRLVGQHIARRSQASIAHPQTLSTQPSGCTRR